MKIICPKCKSAIGPDGVNVAKAVAYCAPCGEAFALSQFVNSPARVAAPSNPSVSLTRVGERIAVAFPRAGLKGIGCFMLLFSLFWNGITWTVFLMIFLTAKKGGGFPAGTGAFDVFGILFLIPFLLIGLLTLGIAVYCIWGDSAVAMDRKELLFERRLFGRKWTRTYAVADIADIRLSEAYKQNDRPVYGVGIHFTTRRSPLTFGSALTEEEKAWLVGELYAFWKEQS